MLKYKLFVKNMCQGCIDVEQAFNRLKIPFERFCMDEATGLGEAAFYNLLHGKTVEAPQMVVEEISSGEYTAFKYEEVLKFIKQMDDKLT